jgi:hypothetical protein
MKILLHLLLLLVFTFPNENSSLTPNAHSFQAIINISLNDGKKWEADEHTKTRNLKMQTLCETRLSEKAKDDELLQE